MYCQVNLMHLDVMPARCGIEVESVFDPATGPRLVRFRAVRMRRLRPDVKSDWSGWFAYEGEPIALRWQTFWE